MSTEKKPNFLSKLKFDKQKFADFYKELKSLDVKEYGTWSQPVKIMTWAVAGFLSAMFVFLLLVSPKFDNINFEIQNNDQLLEQFKKTHYELITLESQQNEIDKLSEKFKTQLDRLPKEAEITGLIDDVGRLSSQSGFRNVDLSLGQEQQQDFYVEQPITITGLGTFHSFGNFMTAISTLPRIITVDNYKITAISSENHKDIRQTPVLKYSIEAKTYRHLSEKELEEKKKTEQINTPENGSE